MRSHEHEPRSGARLLRTFAARATVAVALGAALAAPFVVRAQGIDFDFPAIQNAIGLAGGDPRIIIARVIRVLLGFLGIIAIGIILYGGYLWMTAAGNSDRIETAKQVLRNGLIGFIIIALAFSIVSFLLSRLLGLGGGGGGGPHEPPAPCTDCSDLGDIIEDHYPERDQTGVPRNTAVIITFREAIRVVPDGDVNETTSFIADAVASGQPFGAGTCGALWCGRMNEDIFDVAWRPTEDPEYEPFSDFDVFTNDERTFVFLLRGAALLGSPDRNTPHRATVQETLRKKSGDVARLNDYVWQFEVSTIIDTTPPKIVDVFPYDDDLSPRNATVMIRFNEPVNPISAAGVQNVSDDGDPSNDERFENLVIAGSAGPINGRFEIGNGYRTVQFTTFDECGTNSCGQPIFCLPKNTDLTGTVLAASLWGSGPTCPAPNPTGNPSRACIPSAAGRIFDGVVDMATNSLDGSRNTDPATGLFVLPTGNGTADGPPADTLTWSFTTNDAIVTSGPTITAVTPVPGAIGVGTTEPFNARFTRRLRNVVSYVDHLNTRRDPARIYEENISSGAWVRYQGGFVTRQETTLECSISNNACTTYRGCLETDDNPLNFCGKESVDLKHTGLTMPEDQSEKRYEPRLASTILDAYQNCFYPSDGPTDSVPPPDAFLNVSGDIDGPTP